MRIKEEALAEFVRVLEPGGRILIEEPDLTMPFVNIKVTRDTFGPPQPNFPCHRTKSGSSG